MTEFTAEEVTMVDVKHPSKIPARPTNDVEPADAVNGQVGDLVVYLGDRMVGPKPEIKRSQGGQSKFTPEMAERLFEKLREGVPVKTACTLAGISQPTLSRWKSEENEGKRGELTDFFVNLDRARAEGEYRLLQLAGYGDGKEWSEGPSKSAKWKLERIFGKQYAPRIGLKLEEMGDIYLDIVTKVCGAKDCGCYQAILTEVSAIEDGEGAASGS